MIQKLLDILGMISGYKQAYQQAKEDLAQCMANAEEAEGIADQILAELVSWDETPE